MPWQTGGGGAYGSLGKMLAGSLGGVCGVVATYPLDTLRARLAVHPKAGMHFFFLANTITNLWDCNSRS